MAKANFHKNQRVYVKPVGTWAVIEQVKPQWVRDVPEPVRVYYDCGLGRDFSEAELSQPETRGGDTENASKENWRLMRAKNKWHDAESSAGHPYPGTFPVVVTDEKDWGGWRVPGQEYDRDPHRIEFQARVMTSGLRLARVARELVQTVRSSPGDVPAEVEALATEAKGILEYIDETPAPAAARTAAE